MTSDAGYFKVARGWMDHPELASSEPLSRREAWLWLIEEAAFTDHRKRVGSSIVELRRGQLSHSLRFMAKAWGWEEKKVRRFLDRLKTAAMIAAGTAADRDRTQLVITICNYAIYQSGDQSAGASSAADRAADRAAVAPQMRRKLERREEGNIESPSSNDDLILFSNQPRSTTQDGFEAWWKLVPKKVGKGQARKAFTAAMKRAGSLDVLSDSIKRYATSVAGTEERYIAHPASWLNGERWLDETTIPSSHEAEIDQEWEAAKAKGQEAMDAFIDKHRGAS